MSFDNKKYSFERGWGQLKADDQPKVKEEIMTLLKLRTRASWYPRLRGEVEPSISEYNGIEKIFRKRKIVKVWGKSKKQSKTVTA